MNNLKYENNDSCHAEIYASKNDGKLIYIHELEKYYVYKGERWGEDLERHSVASHKAVIEELENHRSLLTARLKEAEANAGINDASTSEEKSIFYNSHIAKTIMAELKELKKGIPALKSNGRIKSMIDLAKAEKGMSKSITTFDSKGHFLGVQNGVVNLKKDTIANNEPDHLITKQCKVVYDRDAQCPNWDKLLETICQGNKDYIEYLQVILGSALLGMSGKSKLVILCGHGANGKSTIVDTVKHILNDYSVVTTAKAITSSQANKEYYLASIRGARLVLVNELEAGTKLDEGTVKTLIDSGETQARLPFGKPFTFQPTSTTIVTTNYPPRISADYAINRRLAMLSFDYKIPKEDRNPNYRQEVLEPELSGILNWLIEGCKMYMDKGMDDLPPAVQASTDEFIAQNDRIGQFIDSDCIHEHGKRISLKDFEQKYREWLDDHGYKELASDRISNDLRSRGYEVRKSTGGLYCVIGIRFKTPSEVKTGLSVVATDDTILDEPQGFDYK